MADQSKIGDPSIPASSSMSMAVRNDATATSSPALPPRPDSDGANSNGLVTDGNGLAGEGNGNGLDVAAASNGHTAADDALSAPSLYLNRELTWLAFNQRVLAEAEDEANPLLERVKFLAIGCSTIDEFFMKRIGGLKQQVVAGLHELTPDGRT